MFVFRKIWRALLSCCLCFEIRPFALLQTNCPTIDYTLFSSLNHCHSTGSQLTFTGSKSTVETLQKGVKSVQS